MKRTINKAQSILPTLLDEFHERLTKNITLEAREIRFAKATDKIKVAIGMRRTGKTYSLYQKIKTLVDQGIPLSRILYLNFEDDRLLPLTREKLAYLIEDFYALYPDNHDQHCFLFLDEIQVVEDWALVVRRIFDTKNVEIFLSGSSAKLLSKEIATQLRGRSLSTEVWPYSFNEFLKAKAITFTNKGMTQKNHDILHQQLCKYLSEGGFPETIQYDALDRQKTLQEYVDVVILRDIIERHHVSNTILLKYMIKTLLTNVACGFAVNKFYNDVKSQGIHASKDTIHEYFSYIEEAYMAFGVKLFSESVRKSQINPRKIYVIDSGLAKAFSAHPSDNTGHLFENLIYLDLRRQGYEVFYYLTKERYEVDFLAKTKSGDMRLIQVVWDNTDPKTAAREMRALAAAEKELGIQGEIITPEVYIEQTLRSMA